MVKIYSTRHELDDSGRDHRPLSDHTIEGDNIDEIIAFCLDRIVPKSRTFYEREIRQDLSLTAKSSIDVYAGMGMYYNIVLKSN